MSYISDVRNGYIKSYETGDFIYELKLIPALSSDSIPQFTVQLRINTKDGTQVLDFNEADDAVALEREGYLSFEVLEDVEIQFDGKIIKPEFHHYERNYHIKSSVDVLFQFKNIQPKGDAYFVYRDEIFDQGLVKIQLDKELFTICHVEK